MACAPFLLAWCAPQGGLPSTACGYGDVVPSGWPGQMAVGISASSPILTSGSLQACGACLRLTCDARQVTVRGQIGEGNSGQQWAWPTMMPLVARWET